MRTPLTLFLLFSLLFLADLTSSAAAKKASEKIASGKIYLTLRQSPSSTSEPYQVSYNSSIKSELKATQSSIIKVEAKLKFESENFVPEFISLRLKHPKHSYLTQPVKFQYDTETSKFKCELDFGDPKTVLPYSDVYKIELAIADEQLEDKVSNQIATVRVSFKSSMSENLVPNKDSSISYSPRNLILSDPPEDRIDPPKTFTTFILLVMGLYTVIFLYGLFFSIKANVNNIPTSSIGLVLNIALIGLLGINLVFLVKFWVSWTFLVTMHNFIWLIVPTALVANYALQYIRTDKRQYSSSESTKRE